LKRKINGLLVTFCILGYGAHIKSKLRRND